MTIMWFLCGFVVLTSYCDGANILAFIQIPSYSHQVAFRPLWQELAKRGHNITLITTDPMQDFQNISQIDLSSVYQIIREKDLLTKFRSGEYGIIEIIKLARTMMKEMITRQVNDSQVQNLLHGGQKFDLVITEFLATLGLAFCEKLKTPCIGVTSLDAHYTGHDAVGNPTHPIANPDYDLPFSTDLNLKERILSTLYSIFSRLAGSLFLTPIQDEVVKKYIGEMPSSEQLSKNLSMLFINANPIFNNIRPLGPQTVNIGGGIHLSKPKPLPEDLKMLIDTAKEGVIYFSLGTNVRPSHLSNETKHVIVKTFSQLSYKIFWKFEDENIQGKTENVEIRKWFPQQDILGNNNVKLFITQGGLQSMEEAIFNHVPMVGMPFIGDQPNNVNKMVVKGFGLSVDHTSLTVDDFKNAIMEVIENPKFKQKTVELADLILDQPMTGLEKAVWWTEYVIRHKGARHLKSPIVDMPLYQYYLLDVFCAVIGILVSSFYIIYKLIHLFCRCVKYIVIKNTKVKKL